MLKISVINKTNNKEIEKIFTKKLKSNLQHFDNPKQIVLKTVDDTMHHVSFKQKLEKSIRVSNELIGTACVYCAELFKNKQLIRQTKCNHYFHKKCIDTWVLKYNQSKCPSCNSNI
jgi:hypothetical protein